MVVDPGLPRRPVDRQPGACQGAHRLPGSYPSTLLDAALKGGTAYTIRYSSYSYHDGFRLRWGPVTAAPTPPPLPNDDFVDAVDLGSTPKGATSGTSQWSTLEPAEPTTTNEVDSTVWYGWTASFSGLATIGSPQYGMSTRIWTGQSLAGLQAVPPTYWGDPSRRPTFEAVAGMRYWIQLGGTYSQGSHHNLSWDITAPANDDLADAYVLPSGPSGVSPHWGVVRSTAEPGEPPTYGDDTARNTVWLRWKPTYSGHVSFVTSGDHVPALDIFTSPTTPRALSADAGRLRAARRRVQRQRRRDLLGAHACRARRRSGTSGGRRSGRTPGRRSVRPSTAELPGPATPGSL